MDCIGRRYLPRSAGRNIVAAFLAALLTIAPFADRGLIHGAGGPLAVHSPASDVDALSARDPVTAPRASQSSLLGVLSRLLTGETKLGSGPGETPFLAAGEHDVALFAATTATAAPVSLPRRSRFATAHPPTGPPA